MDGGHSIAVETPFLGSSTRPKRDVRSVAVLSFFGGVVAVVASACILGAVSGNVKDAISLYSGAVHIPMEEKWCTEPNFRDVAMKTAVDATIFGLVKDIHAGPAENHIETKFEASGVVLQDHAFYVICDSSWSIPVFHDLSQSGSFESIYDPMAPAHARWKSDVGNANYLIPPADLDAFPHDVDSNWESITYHSKKEHHIVTQESLMLKDGKYHAIIMEVSLHHHPKPKWDLVQACRSEFEFKDESKGFEGMMGMDGIDGRFFLLGLCEGNHCDTGEKGKEHGYGQMVIMEFDAGEGPPNTFEKGYLKETSTCSWKTLKVVDVPSIAQFEDYSDVARLGDKIAISSQASASMLFGTMTLDDGLLNPDTFKFTGDHVTRFAPTPNCQVQYCNVEGIEFINDRMIVASSDSMKGGGRQPFMCLDKDQSMHVFALPNAIEL